ncbi:MAG TPA: pilus assembly protein TadG-related protein, partial [Bryobacteraceae bacterium]|nr:pilus assembly protein TadG-related protein [Bryobacteraceae bacterium]
MISRKTISRKKAQRGQAIVMVTLALIAMAGLLGLAVDLGWSYFVKKSAQAAADSGALAAITAGQRGTPGNPPYTSCPAALTCTSQPTACSSISHSSNLWSACLYAQQNGFTDTNAVFVDADIPSHRAFTPLNSAAGTVHVFYWVTVRVNRQIPQLFSAVLNNTTALVSARATGALTDTVVQGSLILLNRENDSTPFLRTGAHGVDLVVGGNAPVQAPAGMLISSTNCGQHVSTNCADTTNAAA